MSVLNPYRNSIFASTYASEISPIQKDENGLDFFTFEFYYTKFQIHINLDNVIFVTDTLGTGSSIEDITDMYTELDELAYKGDED